MFRRQLYQTVPVASVALYGGLKARLPLGLPCKNFGEYKKKSDIERAHEPSYSPPGVHVFVHLLVDLVRLLRPHHPLRKSFQRRVRTHCLGLETVPGLLPGLPLFELELLCGNDQDAVGVRRRKERTRSSQQKDLLERGRYLNGL